MELLAGALEQTRAAVSGRHEDRAHAFAGCHAHAAGTGIQRLCATGESRASERLAAALDGIYELPLGGTAVGTGVNAPEGFAARTIALIAERTGLPFREARNHFEAQAAKDAVSF